MADVIDKDHGLRRIAVDVATLRNSYVKVGVMGSETAGGVSVTDYAAFNEFGTRHIPARPFMATTHDREQADVSAFIQTLIGDVLDGNSSPDHVLRTLGEHYQSRVQNTIRTAKDWAVPNAAATVAMKGSSSPLIDQGRMIGAIRYTTGRD